MATTSTPSSKEVMIPIGKASLAEEKTAKHRKKRQNVKPLKKPKFQHPPNIFRLSTQDMVPVYHFSAHKLWPKDLYVIPNYCFGVESSNVDIILSVEHSAYKWVDCETGRELLHWQGNKTALWELNERLGRNDLIYEGKREKSLYYEKDDLRLRGSWIGELCN